MGLVRNWEDGVCLHGGRVAGGGKLGQWAGWQFWGEGDEGCLQGGRQG